MANRVYQKQKESVLLYSKKEIDRAARSIRYQCTGLERERCITVIQNFREIHLYPLMLIKNHLARAAFSQDKNAIIARRLKRLPTIINKLERPSLDGESTNAIQLTRMQDIGGCRAILKDKSTLLAVKSILERSSSVHKIVRVSDYLNPKASGYGGVHLVYSCYEGETKETPWKKVKIEVQLRTELQHAWATSLEIIDTLEGIDLKTSHDGHNEWREFFSLAGLLVANSEKFITLESVRLFDVRNRFRELERELRVRSKLSKFNIALNSSLNSKNSSGLILVSLTKKGFDDYLLQVNRSGSAPVLKGNITRFRNEDSDLAIKALDASEADENVLMSVLVSASHAKTLTTAYPNFFGSTNEFTAFINRQVRVK